MEIKIIAQMEGKFEHTNRIYDVDGLAPTLSTPCGGGHIPKILEQQDSEIIACFAMGASRNYGMKPNGGHKQNP